MIERFHAPVLPVTEQARVSLEITPARRGIEEHLSAEALAMLRSFSGAANHATGTGHPNDHRRWMDFVIQAHMGGVRLDATTLGRWCREEERVEWRARSGTG